MKVRRTATTADDLHPLIDAAYEAATRQDGWSSFVGMFATAVGADAAVIQIYDTVRYAGNAVWWWGTPDEAVADYPNWIAKNPHLIALGSRTCTGLLVPNSPVERSHYLRSEYYNDFMRPHLPLYATLGFCIYSDGPLSVSLAADRVAKKDEYDLDHARMIAILLPHLQRAMLVYRRLAEADLERTASVDAINRMDFGVVFLSNRGSIVASNDAARMIFADADALTVGPDARIRAVETTDRSALDRLIGSASGVQQLDSRPAGGAMRINRTNDLLPLEVLVAPLRLRAFPLTRDPPAAVMFIRDPQRTPAPLAKLQQFYDLTFAEARFAQQLMTGRSVHETGEALEVTMATARTHVRRLLTKIKAKSISDLTRRLAGLPPVK